MTTLRLVRRRGVILPLLLLMGLAMLGWAPSVIADTLPPVYHPQRLQTVRASITVIGSVTTTPTRQNDGDVTFEVQSDSQGYHAEIVCVFPPALPLRERPARATQTGSPFPTEGIGCASPARWSGTSGMTSSSTSWRFIRLPA
jgi:hypothetical protein